MTTALATPPAAADPVPPAGDPPPPASDPAPPAPPASDPAPPPAPDPLDTVPETYALARPEDASFIGDDELEVYNARAKALGLTTRQAQNQLVADNLARKAYADACLVEAKADPTIGGDKFDAHVELAKKGLAYLFPGERADMVRAWLERTGLGNHKWFIEGFARVGQGRKEDTPPAAPGSSNPEPKRLADRMYPDMKKKD